jgi:hypothetical protein
LGGWARSRKIYASDSSSAPGRFASSGEFFDQESFNGRAICVRFIFSDITPTSFRLEQAFSEDGGKTWEANWIATFAKVG